MHTSRILALLALLALASEVATAMQTGFSSQTGTHSAPPFSASRSAGQRQAAPQVGPRTP